MKKKAPENLTTKVKCAGCHAYYVEMGELCANCQAKSETEEDNNE